LRNVPFFLLTIAYCEKKTIGKSFLKIKKKGLKTKKVLIFFITKGGIFTKKKLQNELGFS